MAEGQGGTGSVADLLFVYGTLRPALWPVSVRPWLTRSSLVGSGSVAGWLYDLGPHPAAVLDPTAESRIVGEVLSLAEDQLRALDEYEGYDPDRPETSYYVRVSCRVRMAGGGELT